MVTDFRAFADCGACLEDSYSMSICYMGPGGPVWKSDSWFGFVDGILGQLNHREAMISSQEGGGAGEACGTETCLGQGGS